MSKISEIDELLSDSTYVYSDGFWGFYDIAKVLKIFEWLALIELSKSRGEDWNNNLRYAQPFKQGDINEVLPCVFIILDNNRELAVEMLAQLDSRKLSKLLNEEHIKALAEIWKLEPRLRDSIKVSCCDAQKAGELRRYLGLSSWAEASEKYP
jgi:hypothetical protein